MMNEEIRQHLVFIYGEERANTLLPRLSRLMEDFQGRIHARRAGQRFHQRDAVLITYGDMVQQPGERPLQTLASFLQRHVAGVIDTVHLLPFYPYSSDDGFSVIDYQAVDAALGNWQDVADLGRSFRLMFDAVINHISAGSDWFHAFLQDDPRFRDYFICVDPATDLSAVFRPRALPLLTEVATRSGPRHVWTTFSADQIDLNYANPELLLAVTELLLFYVARGAELIRLDAIAFMWKEIGTDSLHRPQTHRIIQLWRSILDVVAPQVILITETNVPHRDNIAYFGDGRHEAQMVYNFSLPPLTLHALHTGDATPLTQWAQGLTRPSAETSFFNFLASHDGIGLTPARGLLPESALQAMAQRVRRLGGHVSYKNNPDGSQSPYELNINYLDALADPDDEAEPPSRVARRFLAAQAIMLALRGVPGIYFHSLFGSRGWPEGVQETGRARTINRQKLRLAQLESELASAGSLRQQVFAGFRRLLRVRAASPAFHPAGEQVVHPLGAALFAVERIAPGGDDAFLCLHNVSDREQHVDVPVAALASGWGAIFQEMIQGEMVAPGDGQALSTSLSPYQVKWFKLRPRIA